MSRAPSPLADLLSDCDAQGIRLLLADDGALTIDATQDALTPDLLDRLKAHKGELLTLLQTKREDKANNSDHPKKRAVEAVCPCGSTTWRDVPIHDGRSVRRDCGRCRRFIEFPVWYGKELN